MFEILRRLLPEKITDERELRSTVQLLQTLLLVSLVAGGAALLLTVIGNYGLILALPLVMLLVSASVCLVLLRRGMLLPAQILLPSTLYIVVTFIVTIGYGLHDIDLLAYAGVIAVAGLTLGQEASFAFGILIVLSVFGIGTAEIRGLLKSPTSSLTNSISPFNLSIVVLAIAFVQRVLILRLNENIRRTHENELAQIEANTELRKLKSVLENRVGERTSELQSVNAINVRRANQFEAITQITSAINSIRNTSELLPKITSVVSEQFGYYHTGIFLNDENNLHAYLTAANSEGGQIMLARGHNLKIGEQGIVGYVAANNQSRVARKVGEDAVFFNNPDLPETKAEMALPLRAANKVIGVLDVQSIHEEAFSEDDIRVLGILADQVSLAIENTRLYETTRRSLEEAEALYRQYLRQAWSRLPREKQLTGYRYNQRGMTTLESLVSADEQETDDRKKDSESGARLNVPIKLRGETIGNLIIQVPQGRQWNQDQLDLVEAVAERVALSAENARLFDETSRRAERERMVTEITSKIRSTNDPEAMIQTALDELRNALGATQVQLIPQAISASQQNQNEIISSTPQDSAQKGQRGNGVRK